MNYNSEAREYFLKYLKDQNNRNLYKSIYLQFNIQDRLYLNFSEFCEYFHTFCNLSIRGYGGLELCLDMYQILSGLMNIFAITELKTSDMTTGENIVIYT